VDPEAIAPNAVVKVSRPRRGELKFNAGAAAVVERNKVNEVQLQKAQQLKDFQKVSQQRAAARLRTAKASEDSPKKKADLAKAMKAARQGLRTFEKIIQ
jgi:hypothetical protein